jgi:dihydrofolate reductase
MKISMIAAMAKNNVIGINGALPWNLSDDLKYFKKTTTGKTIIMGRKTFLSIGKALPNRENIILTKDTNFKAEKCIILHSTKEVLKKYANEEEIIIIGGGEIYKAFLPYTDKIYLTIIDAELNGDTFFPHINKKEWLFKLEHEYQANDKNSHDFNIFTLNRKKAT